MKSIIWERFWCPKGHKFDLSDNGYLADPMEKQELGIFQENNYFLLEDIAHIPCLVLLGEPGMGKTTTLQAYYQQVKNNCNAVYFDLGMFQDQSFLFTTLSENNQVKKWKHSSERLYIFLDSFDEGLHTLKALAKTLNFWLQNLGSIENLYLRITSRPADWSEWLEDSLRRLWGEEKVCVHELAPLRCKDVKSAAEKFGVNPDLFIQEVNRLGVVPLAIKPITLQFLLEEFKNTGALPLTQWELYQQGCEKLCMETDQYRRELREIGTGQLSPRQRMMIAARIAAVTIFCNYSSICSEEEQQIQPSQSQLKLDDLSGGTECLDGFEFSVTIDSLRETLGTALFSSRSPHRWSHQTYAEFLAALYLIQHKVPTKQIMSMLTNPADPERKIIPQLRETAAWLAVKNSEVLDIIIENEPEVLLQSNVITTEEEHREILVEKLLALWEKGTVFDFLANYSKYSKLKYSGLHNQIKPYIFDKNRRVETRNVAIDIADSCRINSLQDELLELVLDSSEYIRIRENAAYAILNIADENTKAKLKPLALNDCQEDEYKILKGCALKAIWPEHISAEELFSIFESPSSDCRGSYSDFLRNNLVQKLNPEGLPVALNWVERQPNSHKLTPALRDLMEDIMKKAWDHLYVPGVIIPFARAVVSRLKNNDTIFEPRIFDDSRSFRKELLENDEKRRYLLEALLPFINEKPRLLVFSSFALEKDFFWILNLLPSKSEKEQVILAVLLEYVFNKGNLEQNEALLTMYQRNQALTERFKKYFAPVKIDSPEAKELKEEYYERKKIEERQSKKKISAPSLNERIQLCLNGFEPVDAWGLLVREIAIEPGGMYYGDELNCDLTSLPRWEYIDDEIKIRLINAAREYILQMEIETQDWLGEFYRPAIAGVKAFVLLLKKAPAILYEFSSEVWKRWAPAIIASLVNTTEDYQELVKIAYGFAPNELLKTLIDLIDKENLRNSIVDISVMKKVAKCWDNRMAAAILKKAKDTKLKPETMECLLRYLREHHKQEAEEYARELVLGFYNAQDENQRKKAIIAARDLVKYSTENNWMDVWVVIKRDVQFGKEVITSLWDPVPELDNDVVNMLKKLSEAQLLEFYTFLTEHFLLHKESREADGFFAIAEQIIRLRSMVLDCLQEKGSFEACETIQKLMENFPEEDNRLKVYLHKALETARIKTWVPLQPKELLSLVNNPQKRSVNSGTELLKVLMESLQRLEKKLHGETPMVVYLWNDFIVNHKKIYLPKDEESFSDMVKWHLQEDLKERGIVVNREVAIRRGEKTDIHVDAIVKDQNKKHDIIKAIIEVKCCWHSELKQAMKTQLVDRYLKDNECRHGLYLVGWFNCEKWDKNDYRRGISQNMSKDEAQAYFEKQAKELSRGDLEIRAFVMNTALR